MNKKYNVIETEEVSLGRFTINLDQIQEDIYIYPYSYIKVKKSVGILPIYKENVLIIRQYRHALGTYEYEIPGGTVDNNEIPENTAIRELSEETGFVTDKIEFLGSYYPSPGSSNEETFLYVAFCHPETTPMREPLEYIEQKLVSKLQMEELIATRKFHHGMGLVAWLYYKMLMKGF